MPEKPDPKELAALDAIIAFSLAGQDIEELSDEEVLKLAASCPPISAQGQAILDRLGASPFSKRLPRKESGESRTRRQEPAGMYREGSDENLDPKLKEEIERKREEIRARLKDKRTKDV